MLSHLAARSAVASVKGLSSTPKAALQLQTRGSRARSQSGVWRWRPRPRGRPETDVIFSQLAYRYGADAGQRSWAQPGCRLCLHVERHARGPTGPCAGNTVSPHAGSRCSPHRLRGSSGVDDGVVAVPKRNRWCGSVCCVDGVVVCCVVRCVCYE